MHWLIIIFGTLIALLGVVILARPSALFDPMARMADQALTQVLAVVTRIILGALLITLAHESRYPLAVEIIGWISIFAALFLAFIGRRNFKRLMAWALSLADRIGRVAGMAAVLFGAFLVHAFT